MRGRSWFGKASGLTAVLSVGLLTTAPAGANDWDDGSAVTRLSPAAPAGFDFRALERSVHAEMNAMRQNPSAYADKIAARRSAYRGNTRIAPDGTHVLTHEGVAALDEAVDALRGANRLPRLAWSDLLQAAALGHARDLDANNLVGHDGSDGSQPQDRVALFAKADGWVAENIAFGPRTGEDVVIGLIVDDGVADRGHRKVLLKPDLFVAGTGCGPHPTYGVVCVINYATRVSGGGEAPVAEAPSAAPPAGVFGNTQPPIDDLVGADDEDWQEDGWVEADDADPDWQVPTVPTPGAAAPGVPSAPLATPEAPSADADAFTCPFVDTPTPTPAPRAPSWGPPTETSPDAMDPADLDAADPWLADETPDVGPWAPRPMPRAPAAALYDDRYPADHPRNQPPGMREVKRPILRTEGPRRGSPQPWQAPRERRWERWY